MLWADAHSIFLSSILFWWWNSKILIWPLDLLNISHAPECGPAAVQPVVLWRAVRAAVLVSVVPAETDPEVSVGRPELRDELFYDLLLRSRLHAQQLPSVPPAGELCLGEVQPPPQLGEVGKLVARLLFSCLAHALTCNNTHTHTQTHHKCQMCTDHLHSYCGSLL